MSFYLSQVAMSNTSGVPKVRSREAIELSVQFMEFVGLREFAKRMHRHQSGLES